MASGFYNGSVLTDSGAAADSYVQNQQNGTIRSTMGYQNSSSSWKLSMGAFGTNDTIIPIVTGKQNIIIQKLLIIIVSLTIKIFILTIT